MRIPTTTVNFEEEGYTTENGEALWLKVPRSVREGQVHDIQELSRSVREAGDAATPAEMRQLNLLVLEFVTDWNFDDSAGKQLPIISTMKDADEDKLYEKKTAVASQIPIEVINKVVRAMTQQEVSKSN